MSFCVTLEFCLALALARIARRREYNIFFSQQNDISAGLSATEIISRTGRFEMATYYSAK
jgi:hypothetical protein